MVVVSAAAAVLINELHGGWQWWVSAIVVVLVWAGGAGWLAFQAGGSGEVVQGPGSVVADQIMGSVKTETTMTGWFTSPSMGGGAGGDGEEGDGVIGPGAVRARAVGGDVSTRTNWECPQDRNELGDRLR